MNIRNLKVLAGVVVDEFSAHRAHPHMREQVRPTAKDREIMNLYGYHEAGHAIIAHLNTYVREITEIRVTPQGAVTSMIVESSDAPEWYWTGIAVKLGGIAGDLLYVGKTVGRAVAGDLRDARELCRRLIARYPVTEYPWREAPRRPFDVNKMFRVSSSSKEAEVLNHCYDKCAQLLEGKREEAERLAYALATRGKVMRPEITACLGGRSAIIATGLVSPGIIEV